jgi:hypothetical protein
MSNTQSKVYLEAAKYHYEEMKANFQDRKKFTYSLIAFLAIARSVTLVFQKESHDNGRLGDWYNNRVKDWKNNKIMRFFIGMRNVVLKEHSPTTCATVEKTWGIDFIIGNPLPVQISRTEDGKEVWSGELPLKSSKVVKYSFGELPQWFDLNSDVIYLCKLYLDELERFVTEAQNLVKERNEQ